MNRSRRAFLGTGAGLAAAGAMAAGLPGGVRSATGSGPAHLRGDGGYDTVELAKPAWTLGLAQTRVHRIDGGQARPALQRNLEGMLEAIDRNFHEGAGPDLLQFHDFPLQGGRRWTRREASELSIELPGVETEAIGRKCREYAVWIVFGAYVRDPDWPGHVLSITTLMDDKGRIVDRHW